jgi:hypothetical protein
VNNESTIENSVFSLVQLISEEASAQVFCNAGSRANLDVLKVETSTPRTSYEKESLPLRARLVQEELQLMKRIHNIQFPGFRRFSMAIHYSLLPQVMAPIFAVLAWMVSLPMAGSLICFLNAQDILNSAIKWSIQRPRPMWYSNSSDQLVESKGTSSVASWEADFSFPSAHTQFFAGLAFCACAMMTKNSVGATTLAVQLGMGC